MQASLLLSFLFGTAKDLNIVNFAGQPAGQKLINLAGRPAGRTNRLPVGSGHENLDRFHLCHTMCSVVDTMIDIQSATAEIRWGKKKKER